MPKSVHEKVAFNEQSLEKVQNLEKVRGMIFFFAIAV